MPDNEDAKAIGLDRLSNLSTAQRTTVRNALKSTLDAHLAGAVVRPGTVAADPTHEKESGPLHGKDFSRGQSDDLNMLTQVAAMDEASFKQLATRLTTLRGSAPG